MNLRTVLLLLFLAFGFVISACSDASTPSPTPDPTNPTNPTDPTEPTNPTDPDPSDPSEEPDDPAITIAATELTLKQGEIGETAIVITRYQLDDDEPVELELGAVPEGLSASFAGDNPTEETSAVLRVETSATTALTTYEVPVQASSGELEDSTTLTVNVIAADAQKADYNGFSAGLPGWSQFLADKGKPLMPDENEAAGSAEALPTEVIGDVEYDCTTTPYNLTRTPEKIVALNPDTAALWVGGLIQGEGHVNGIGSLKPLPISQRAPLILSIDLLSGNNTKTVENPNLASVQQAIGDLVAQAEAQGVKSGSRIFYNEKRAHSLQQVALDLGLSVNYMGASVATQLGYDSSKEETTMMAHFVHQMFTVTMVTPQTPEAFYSDAFTQEALDRQVQLGNMGPTNIPVYVSSVTYGRILTFTFTSSASEQEIKAALQASYSVAEADLSAEQKKILGEAEVQVVTVGGDEKDARAIIQSGNLKDYFDSSASLSTAVPISYELRNVGDNSIAKISESTNYNITECTASPVDVDPIGAKVKVVLQSIRVHDACDSGLNGSDGEVYGRILVDGFTQFEIPSDEARKTADNEIITVPIDEAALPGRDFYFAKGVTPRVQIEGFLKDKDSGKDDDIADWNFTVNPFSYGTKTNRSSPDCSATLTYRVVKVQDLFE